MKARGFGITSCFFKVEIEVHGYYGRGVEVSGVPTGRLLPMARLPGVETPGYFRGVLADALRRRVHLCVFGKGRFLQLCIFDSSRILNRQTSAYPSHKREGCGQPSMPLAGESRFLTRALPAFGMTECDFRVGVFGMTGCGFRVGIMVRGIRFGMIMLDFRAGITVRGFREVGCSELN